MGGGGGGCKGKRKSLAKGNQKRNSHCDPADQRQMGYGPETENGRKLGMKDGLFGKKRGLFRNVHVLEILESLEIVEIPSVNRPLWQ